MKCSVHFQKTFRKNKFNTHLFLKYCTPGGKAKHLRQLHDCVCVCGLPGAQAIGQILQRESVYLFASSGQVALCHMPKMATFTLQMAKVAK